MGWGLLDTGRASVKMNNINVKMMYRKEHGEQSLVPGTA